MKQNRIIFDLKYTPYSLLKNATEQQRMLHEEERRFYTTGEGSNYIDYMNTEHKRNGEFTAFEYFQKNTGLFNDKGMITEDELKEIQKRLRKNKGNIWHGFISLNQEDSKCIDTAEKSIEFIKRTMKKFFDETHFNRKNIDLICALHTDRPHHYHLHFLFAEKEPTIRNSHGEMEYRRKGKLSPTAIDNFLIRAFLYLDKGLDNLHLSRDESLKELSRLTRFKNGFVNVKEIRDEIISLSKDIPLTGRTSYGSKDMEPYRERIDHIVDMLIGYDETAREANQRFYDNVAEREDRIKEFCKSGAKANEETSIPNPITSIEELKFDYRRRQGNMIINVAKKIKPEFYERNPNKQYRTNDKELKRRVARSVDKINRLINGLLSMFGSNCQIWERDLSNRLQEIEEELAGKRKAENRKTEIREEEERRKHWIDDKH